MTRRRLPRRPGPDDGELLFEGDITDYWSPAVVRHWVLHIPDMKPTDFRLYMVLRAMLTSSPHGLRRMSNDELCWLLTEEGEKPVGESTVRAALKRLEKANLVTNPDGERIVTSTGKGGIQSISRRYKVHDLPRTYTSAGPTPGRSSTRTGGTGARTRSLRRPTRRPPKASSAQK